MIDVRPYYRLGPPGTPGAPGLVHLPLAPGRAFGDGRHETTQLCLLAIAVLTRRAPRPLSVLDFGAGNGVLSIAAARAGAQVDAVEIDAIARAEIAVNARLNDVTDRVSVREELGDGTYEIV